MTDDAAALEPGKKKRKKRGAGGAEAEKIVQAHLELEGWLVHRVLMGGFFQAKRPDGTTFTGSASYDLFGCLDLLAIQREGIVETWALQVTVQSGRSARQKKIEAVTAWPVTWRVSLVSHEKIPDPTNRKRSRHFLKVQDYVPGRGWTDAVAEPIDMSRIEALRSAQAEERRVERAAKKAAREAQAARREAGRAEREARKAELKARKARNGARTGEAGGAPAGVPVP